MAGDEHLSEEALAEYIREVRATAVKNLAELRVVDRNAPSDDARAEFGRYVEHWMMVLAMTEPDAVADHLAAAEELGRELTLEPQRR